MAYTCVYCIPVTTQTQKRRSTDEHNLNQGLASNQSRLKKLRHPRLESRFTAPCGFKSCESGSKKSPTRLPSSSTKGKNNEPSKTKCLRKTVEVKFNGKKSKKISSKMAMKQTAPHPSKSLSTFHWTMTLERKDPFADNLFH